MLENLVWQDLVLMIGGFLFTVALIPTLKSKKDKPAKLTSFMTGTLLLIFAITYLSLELSLAFITTLSTAIMWFVIFTQKFFYDKKINPIKSTL